MELTDTEIRSWAVDHAINLNRKGTSVVKILKDAERVYGFMFPKNGEVVVMGEKNTAKM